MNRLLFVIAGLMVTAGAVAYGDPARIALAKKTVTAAASDVTGSLGELIPRPALRKTTEKAADKSADKRGTRVASIPREGGGEFALKAKINGVATPMVIDTGATSVVLTWETAKALGLPIEILSYDINIETASGSARAARLTLDRLAIGNLVERSVPALVVPRGQLKTNLLGMSFLDRLESWEVRSDKLLLRGYP